VSRLEVAGLVLASAAGPRSSRPNPSSRRTSLTAVRPSRGAFLAEPGADLVDRQALAAQLDDPGAGGVFPRGDFAAGDAGRREQGEPACPQVADQRRECVAGVAGGAGGLL
jgi:hypothetical protein